MVVKLLLALSLLGVVGCAVGGSTICDDTQKKEGETKRVVIGDGIYVEAKGGSCQ